MPATNKDPSKAVKEILRKRNVELMDYLANHLVPFAACLRKHGLITKDTQSSMTVTGIDLSQLAQKLMSACEPSLTLFPKKKFPEFIAVMKEFEDMLELAEEMHADYERATGLQLAQSSPEHSVEEDTDSGPTTDPPMDAQMPRHQLQDKAKKAASEPRGEINLGIVKLTNIPIYLCVVALFLGFIYYQFDHILQLWNYFF